MQNREILDIIDLVFFVPALAVATWTCIKHGLARQEPWMFLVLTSALRIIAGSTGIANAHTPRNSLRVASAIHYGVGLAPLLAALMGTLKRLNESMTSHQFPSRFLLLPALLILTGIGLGIAGGLDINSHTPSKKHDGEVYAKASSILFLAVFLALLFVTVWTIRYRKFVKDGERILLLASAITIPFFVVRIVYTLLSAFNGDPKYYSYVSPVSEAVIFHACMALLMEIMIVGVMLFAGLVVKPIPKDAAKPPEEIVESASRNLKKDDGA